MLAQDQNNITQYLAYHKTNVNKGSVLRHIITSTYSTKQKLYEIDNIKLNIDAKVKDYNTIFINCNLYAIPFEYFRVIAKIDPNMEQYIKKCKNIDPTKYGNFNFQIGDVLTNIQDKQINRLNLYYDRPLKYAEFFLRKQGFMPKRGSSKLPALLFPLNEMFEDYIKSILRKKDIIFNYQYSKHYMIKEKISNVERNNYERKNFKTCKTTKNIHS